MFSIVVKKLVFLILLVCVLFWVEYLYLNEEFIIFCSLIFFFFLVVKIVRKNFSRYVFFRVEFIYFSFLQLIFLNLLLIKKIFEFINCIKLKCKSMYSFEFFSMTEFLITYFSNISSNLDHLYIKHFIFKIRMFLGYGTVLYYFFRYLPVRRVPIILFIFLIHDNVLKFIFNTFLNK